MIATMQKFEITQGEFGDFALTIGGERPVRGSLDYVSGYGDAWVECMEQYNPDIRGWWHNARELAKRKDYLGIPF